MEHGHSGRCPLCETTENHRVLRRQEDYITDNINSMFSLIGRMHSLEEVRDSKVIFIMETLHGQKHQIKILQAKCVALQPLIVGLVRNNSTTHSITRLAIGSTMEEVKEE
jgi:hypothetical protein